VNNWVIWKVPEALGNVTKELCPGEGEYREPEKEEKGHEGKGGN